MAADDIGWLASHAWWPVGWLATAWAGRGAGGPLSGPAARIHLGTLVDTLFEGRDPAARWQAGRKLGRLWRRSPEHRERIWQYVWDRYHDQASDDPRIDMSPALARFLLGPDPDTRHVPPVRLVANMSSPEGEYVAEQVVALTQSASDPRVRARITDLLARTDEPHLLTALERAFVAALTGARSTFSGGRLANIGVRPLWEDDGHTPTALLTLLLGNRHLPRPPDPDTPALLAILMVLRGRPDLVNRFDQRNLVKGLLYHLIGHDHRNARARQIAWNLLHGVGPGPAREEICRLAMGIDTVSTAIGVLAEATRIAACAGYLPADPAKEPLFLVLTRQWERVRAVDPDGRRLREYGLGAGDEAELAWRTDNLLRVLDEVGVPDDVRAACRPTLRDIAAGRQAQTVCREAANGSRTAVEVVVETGLVPADERWTPVFLFLTRQWDRYDAIDPDGRRLRAYADRLPPESHERDRLREAAAAGGRPAPCEPALPYWATGPSYGSGISGSGGYTDAGGHSGGGFSVHI
ncbi:hypothetical protein SAMN05443287_10822 [Micromonospora phaseoli]|uniref:HEAT repeat-containing protein n=2 Tax=Micromonospora phaseoli TaxID=1144548 RepID=A0A1H7C1Q0_9ACTN|nr:hypothetical protein CLV64_110262 [Micromonospora phaseoli]GIJ76505.1 hypothetical protein Xph01_09370 [Micromonospora phaseoli]SEJ80942.1 hypothetical protein SAMN05443287_10822 [Micromonospora phaseoli]